MQFPWMIEAAKHLGLQEIAGPKAAPEIVQMAHDIGLTDYESDEDTWCAIFAGACIRRTLPNEPLPSYPQWSRGYCRFGVPLIMPCPGSLCIFWRGKSPSLDLGHAGFSIKETDEVIYTIGGNQTNSVCVAPQLKSKLVCRRWPAGYPIPEGFY